MYENTPKPSAWLRFGVDGPEGIFLSDRAAWSPEHRQHSWQHRGTVVGIDDWSERFVVAAFPMATTELKPCEICGEPDALIFGSGRVSVLYAGVDLEEAERVFDEAFN
jgi:hypothetical protein